MNCNSSVLKDVPSIPIELIRSKEKDEARIALFPSLDYIGLFNVLVNLYDVVPTIQTGRQQLAEALLHSLCCLVPFLPHDYMDTIPYIIATAFPNFPLAIHKDMIEKLCFNVLPFTIQSQTQRTTGPNAQNFSEIEHLSFANISIPAILLMILLWAELPSLHTLLIETLMKLKSDVAQDLFCVIAHGTVKARCPAIELVFQYWPELNPSAADRKALAEKHTPWNPLPCAYEDCSNDISNEAVRMVLDHKVAIGNNWDRIPPLLVCLECADKIYKGKSRETVVDILSPMDTIPFVCESKTCKSPQNQKVPFATCFSSECAMLNMNKPARLCKSCHQERHLTAEGSEGDEVILRAQSKHIYHESIQSPWNMDSESQSYLVEGVVSLLKEAQPIQEKTGKENLTAGSSADKARGLPSPGLPNDESQETMALEERQLLSRYGVWMMTSLCTPVDKTPDEVLGRLLAMLFQWFHCTACLPDDQAGSALERLKGDCIHGWLMKVVKTHFNVFVNCLLPHPLDYAKVGGHWDCWPSQANQIKEGFKRLLCLVPYDIITPEVWSYIMPYWMECFRHEIPEEELSELKILLSKVLDPDLSPLGFTTKQMYEFITVRLDNTSATVQDQALSWIQMLTMLEVPIPIKLLITMLQSGLKSLANKNRPNEPFKGLGKVFPHQASMREKKQAQEEEQKIMSLLRSQPTLEAVTPSGKSSAETPGVKLPPEPIHLTEDEAQISCYILMLDILVKQMELQEVPAHKGLDKEQAQPLLTMLKDILEAPWPGVHSCEEVQLLDVHGELDCPQCSMCELSAIWYQLALVLIEYISPIVEISVTDQAADPMGLRTASPAPSSSSRTGIGHESNTIPDIGATESDGKKIWYTSQGRFEFNIEDLSIEFQLLFVLLNELEKHKDADILYHLLGALKVMCLHAEVLNKAVKINRGFLIWCQENLLMHNLWTLLQAEFSQISQICVPLLLHCITLPSGRDMFWKLVEEDFHDENWRARFTAVERVTTMAHFLDNTSVKNSPSLQSSLANAFCYLVHCLDDIESTVAQRALLNLETIKTTSLKLLLWCLETQFDLVIVDRPMILQTVFQLYNHLNDRRFLTWDFFLNRFDALFLEAQIRLEKIGELGFTRDLKNTNINSEAYQRKLTRAQEALNHAHISRSLSASLGARLQYKRAMSAPVPVMSARRSDKVYGRQASAPTVLKRKSSKVLGASPQIPEKFQQTFAGSSPFISNVDKELELQIQEENHLMSVVHRSGEHQLEFDQDAEDSMHSLITLLMQFLSRPDHSHPSEEKAIQKNQSIVLRHLKILLGYSPVEKSFLILPNHLRNLPVFSAFITAMPKVLDFNYKMGNILLSTCIPLLIYCPSPQKYNHESNQLPLYSLWLLNSHVRQSWLMSVLIIMYKVCFLSLPSFNFH